MLYIILFRLFEEIRSLQIFLEELQKNDNCFSFSKEEIINLLHQRIKILSSHEQNYLIRESIPIKSIEENENFTNKAHNDFKPDNKNHQTLINEKGFHINS